MALSIRTYSDVPSFLQDASPFLRPYALENNRILGTCTALSSLKEYQMPYAMVVLDQLKVKAVVMVMESVAIIGYRSDEEALKLAAQHLQHADIFISSTMGLADEALQFTAAFGKPILRERTFLLYGAKHLQKVKPQSGNARYAELSDLSLLIDWFAKFYEEAGLYPPKQKAELEAVKRRQIASRNVMVWEVDGNPVSLAAIIRTTPDVAILGHVYTPEDRRGKGYSKWLVYALCNEFYKRGHDSFGLYVDAENTPAQRVYKQIGFEELQSCLHVIFA